MVAGITTTGKRPYRSWGLKYTSLFKPYFASRAYVVRRAPAWLSSPCSCEYSSTYKAPASTRVMASFWRVCTFKANACVRMELSGVSPWPECMVRPPISRAGLLEGARRKTPSGWKKVSSKGSKISVLKVVLPQPPPPSMIMVMRTRAG